MSNEWWKWQNSNQNHLILEKLTKKKKISVIQQMSQDYIWEKTPDPLPHTGNPINPASSAIPARLNGSSIVMSIIMHERLEGEDFNLLERKNRQRKKRKSLRQNGKCFSQKQPFLSSPSHEMNEKMTMKDLGTKCTIFCFFQVEFKLFIRRDAFQLPLKTSEMK